MEGLAAMMDGWDSSAHEGAAAVCALRGKNCM